MSSQEWIQKHVNIEYTSKFKSIEYVLIAQMRWWKWILISFIRPYCQCRTMAVMYAAFFYLRTLINEHIDVEKLIMLVWSEILCIYAKVERRWINWVAFALRQPLKRSNRILMLRNRTYKITSSVSICSIEYLHLNEIHSFEKW